MAADAAGGMNSQISGVGDMSGSTMTSSMMPSMTSDVMVSSSMGMNGTHMSGNMTHAPTSKVSTTAGPTSQYTGAGNAAVRHSGVIGTVFGVALLFAFF